MTAFLSSTQKEVLWYLVESLWAGRLHIRWFSWIHKHEHIYQNIKSFWILPKYLWLPHSVAISHFSSRNTHGFKRKVKTFLLEMYTGKLCVAWLSEKAYRNEEDIKNWRYCEMPTKSLPLAIAKESGEWPLHSVFGFALCFKRRRITSLACFVGRWHGKKKKQNIVKSTF